jgi:prolyl 4-hydroxylase
VPRVLSMSMMLNNEYTGGEFLFWKSLSIPVPAGCAIMFPANFMFPHEVLPITSGTRYAMITWFQ